MSHDYSECGDGDGKLETAARKVWDGFDCANYCTPSFRHPSCEASQEECCRPDRNRKSADSGEGSPIRLCPDCNGALSGKREVDWSGEQYGPCACGHPRDHKPGYCPVGCRAPGCTTGGADR